MIFLVPLSSVVAENSRKSVGQFSSDDYQELVEKAVRLLAQGQSEEFRALLSPSMLRRSEKQLGETVIETIIKERYVPFFKTFHHFNPTVASMKTSDADGHRGVAVFRTFVDQVDQERPFVVYVLEEEGELVVGNLLINKTMRDVSLADQK
jgi:hypothetical protein